MPDSSFPSDLTFSLPLGLEGNSAFFGTDVLQGLVEGVRDFVEERHERWRRRSYREGAPALLGCSPWANDRQLLNVICSLPSACVLVSKEPRSERELKMLHQLRRINANTSGIELRALTGLAHKAPKVDGQPMVVGPYDRLPADHTFETFRAVGYRSTPENPRPPFAHSKLVVLGTICWTDEHPSDHVDDFVWFAPRRAWISSANFIFASRRSLEFGFWTEEDELVHAVARWLVALVGASEPLRGAADLPSPELVDWEIDDEAMAEAAAELDWTEVDDEPED